ADLVLAVRLWSWWYRIAWIGGALFFSGRGRHTRFSRDWSSDVCSSDLSVALGILTIIVSLLIGTFTGSLPKGWGDGSIIVVQGEGSRYVALGDTLYPVKNLPSPRLLTGTTPIPSLPAT